MDDINTPNNSQLLIYQSPSGDIKIDVRLESETIWLTQAHMAELFQKDKRTISEHIRNIFSEGELNKNSVVRNFRTTAQDGKDYDTNFYNLDVIISVGYRVKSQQGTQFRIWATQRLKETEENCYNTQVLSATKKHLKNQSMNTENLKNLKNCLNMKKISKSWKRTFLHLKISNDNTVI